MWLGHPLKDFLTSLLIAITSLNLAIERDFPPPSQNHVNERKTYLRV
jgi:hypothetical protein